MGEIEGTALSKRRTFIKQTLAASVGAALLPLSARSEILPSGLTLYFPENADYKRLNTPFNSDLSFAPVAIAACRNETDVVAAVLYAKEKKLKPSIKSGGHSFIGDSFSGGLIIDVSQMKQKVYRAKTDTFTAGPGLKLAEVYDYLLANGRMLPSGSCGGVGLSGLTLGGGYGFFARQHGLTCDHLKSVRMVTAEGNVISSEEHPELLWACRGGGNGHFGVITSMKFSTVKAPAKFTTQKFRAHNLTAKRAAQLMKDWFEVASELPNPMFSAFILNGKSLTMLISSTYSHQGPAFQKAKTALLKAGTGTKTRGVYSKATAKVIKTYSGRPHPLPFRNMCGGYYKGYADIEKISEDICQTTIDNPGIIFQINALGGAINTVDAESAAYAHREYPFLGELQAYWQSEGQKKRIMPGVDKIRQILKDIPAHYANYPDPDLKEPAKAYYGNSLGRLRALKRKLDPGDFFQPTQGLT